MATHQDRKIIKASAHSVLLAANPTVRVLPERTSPFELIAQSRLGIAHGDVRRLATLLELTLRELATLLSMNERTMARRLVSGSLNKVESERLLLLEALAAHGLRAYATDLLYTEISSIRSVT